MSDANYTVFNAMVDIFTSPGKALEEVRNHTSWLWWPLLISIVLASVAYTYFYTWVDFEWFVDQTVAGVPAADRADSEDAIRAFMSPTTSIITTVLAIIVITFLFYSIQAGYLHLAAKLATSAEITYGQWFSFSAWTAFVGVLGSLAVFVVILMADNNQVYQDQLTPFSMNALFIHARMGDDWYNWGNSLNLVNFWMLGLMSFGFARWTGSALGKSIFIAVLPWALVFGIWALTI